MNERRYYIEFEYLPVGAVFAMNGNKYRKRSTRTAEITEQEYAGTWFYFRKQDTVTVTITGPRPSHYLHRLLEVSNPRLGGFSLPEDSIVLFGKETKQ